ncbi:cytochrome c biogenesis protein ResB [Parabacteroides provencensis]|uniref:cytochrome c biogenesis protein ResB n=1 Tax=Parabacteroides provencensis TaxID=1944636 RepID=UPI001180D2E3|nr:cytochrome c biogenesis protein ResB [Parabacteroides provencensis]
MLNRKKQIWETPWGYAESIISIGTIIAVGIGLQMVVGEFDFYLFARPVNYAVVGLVALIAIALGLFAPKTGIARWFTSVEMSVTLIVAFVLGSVIMGLVPQASAKSVTPLGLDAMTRHWAFVFIYSLLLIALGGLIVRRLKRFNRRDWGFYFNHIGLWLFLSASGLGYADMERYVMYVAEGETEWRVYDEQKNVKELPIAITLNDFDMDYYPPKLAVIDKTTGDLLPVGKPHFLQIDKDMPSGTLNGWQVKVDRYIHQAVRGSDSTYREAPMPGATAAVRVTASKNGTTHSGWICGGNQAQLFMTMPLDEQTSLVMTVAEPRIFTSDIEVFTQSEKHLKTVLEVNKPLSVDHWTIYQHGYDNNAGRLSAYSSFELVYDPWLIPVYVGIVMMMIGSVAMIWRGKERKEAVHDVE